MLTAISVHALGYIGEFLIWQSIYPEFANCQIKNLAKVSSYTVCYTSLYELIHRE